MESKDDPPQGIKSGTKLDVKKHLGLLKQIDPDEYETLLSLTAQIEKIERTQSAKNNFLDFVKTCWPSFILGAHHKVMARVIEGIVSGEKTRAIVNLPPRFSKSEFFSYLLPAWFLGKYPEKKIIQACATADLAIGFSRKVRNLVASPEYQQIFPGMGLRQDSKAAGRWHTSNGGEYFAVGAEGNVTGKGGDLVILDDPTGEQEAIASVGSSTSYDRVFQWYTSGPRQRLQPNGRICVVQSRWALNDLTGRLIKAQHQSDSEFADKWEVTELPAILPSGDSLWPEFWPKHLLESTRIALPPARWAAQYMQQPTNDSSSILKREYWKRWELPKPPTCSIKMVTVDTAFSQKDDADYTAFTTWGVFNGTTGKTDKDPGGKDIPNLMLLDAWKERLEFPELKQIAYKHYMKWKPDIFLIEAKASGTPLIYELRARGIPVSDFTVSRGTKLAPNDKISRVNSISDIFASGLVWAPDMRWADEVIEDCAEFPQGASDDIVDCVIMALMRFRQGGFIRLQTDSWDEEEFVRPRRRSYY